MSEKMKDNYVESKNYSDGIMTKITDVLDKSEIAYEVKSGGTEVVVSCENQSLDSIKSIIFSNIDIPKMVIAMLLDIIEAGESIYIRQKTK